MCTIDLRLNTMTAAVLAVMLAHTATAQQGIEEVVVTAQKRQENLSEIPIAISAFSSETLAEKGITTLAGLASSVPSVTATPYPSSSNTLIMFMRGQGSANPMEITQDGAVGLYVDGFYIARPQSSTFDIADVERVEVLRGPQGTLYGRNTTGGAVNIISRKPSGQFGFKQDFTYGSFDQFRSLTSVDLPAFGDVAVKLSHLRSSKDGYVKNLGASNDFNQEYQKASRLALRWQPAENFSADYVFETGKLNSTPVYYQSPGWNGLPLAADGTTYYAAPHRMKSSYREVDLPLSTSEYDGHSLTLNWDISDSLTLRSLTGYRDLDSYIYQDYVEIFFVPYTTIDTIVSRQVSQEFQVIGSALNDQLNYVGGLYYFRESGHHREIIAQALDRFVKAESESAAIYGQLTWTPPILDNRFDVTVGGRYTKDKREASRDFSLLNGPALPQAVTANDESYNRFNPALTLAYRFSDDLNVYAKWATGYRAGGSSEAAGLDNFGVSFSPEDITSYEIGVKSYAWDRRVRLNVAAFRSDLEDMQIAFTATSADPSFTQAYNAGNATIQGVEVDLLIAPTERFSVSVDYTYLDSEIKKVDVIPNTIFSEPGSQYRNDADISRLFNVPYAAKHSVNIAADYTLFTFASGDLRFHVDYDWKDAFYVTTTSGAQIPNSDLWRVSPRGLLNARLTLALELPRGDHAKISLWGKNLADSDYEYFITALGGPLVGYSNLATAWNEPSTFGIDISYQY